MNNQPKEKIVSYSTFSINQTNLIPSVNNNVYRFQFPTNAVINKGDKIAISSVNLYNSFYNIKAAYNNNTFSYVWNAAVPATVNITIPDGNYSISDLNLYLQSVMIANTHYLIDPAGNFVYYLQLTENIVTYKVDFISSPIPNALGTLVFPSGATWALPAVAQTPQLIVPNTDFQRLIGFTPATYPAAIQATVYSVSSTSTPQITDITSIVMTCNMINNPFALPPNTIYTFAITGAFLEFLNPPINELVFNTTVPGLYPYLEIAFLDQLYRELEIRDTNLTITCVLRTVSES